MGGIVRLGRIGPTGIGAKYIARALLLIAALTLGTGWSVKPFIEGALQALSPGTDSENAERRIIRDPLYGVDMLSATVGVAVGYYGSVLTTQNGGADWNHVRIEGGELLRRVHAYSESSIWAVGHRGSIFHSSDRGRSWERSRQPDGIYLRDIAFASDWIGWAVGHDGRILKTSDGGRNWKAQDLSGYAGRDLPRLHAVAAVSPEFAVIAGEFGIVAITANSGETWELLDSPVETTLTAVAATESRAFLVGLDGVALRVEFGEVTAVTRVPTGTDEHLFDIALDQNGRGGAVGKAVLLSFDGSRFAPVSADPALNLEFAWYHGADALPDGTLIAVGIQGSVIGITPEHPAQLIVKSSVAETMTTATRAFEWKGSFE